ARKAVREHRPAGSQQRDDAVYRALGAVAGGKSPVFVGHVAGSGFAERLVVGAFGQEVLEGPLVWRFLVRRLLVAAIGQRQQVDVDTVGDPPWTAARDLPGRAQVGDVRDA